MIKRFGGLLIFAIASLLVSCDGSAGHMTTGGASHEDKDLEGNCRIYYERDYKVNAEYTNLSYLDSVSSGTMKSVRPSPNFVKNANPGRLSLVLLADVDSETVITDYHVEIFGCETHGCPEATMVVVHNGDYSYEKIVYPSDFEISKYKKDISMSKGEIVQYCFHLEIDTEDISLSWDLMTWEYHHNQCPTPLKPAW